MDRPRHLAQANVARQRAPLDSPVMGEFALALDPVYRIAEGSPGFVWRLVSGERHGVAVVEDGVPLTVNLAPAPLPAGPWAVAAGVHPAAAVRPRRAARGPAGPTGLEGG